MAEFNGMDGSISWSAGYDSQVKSFSITDEIDIGRTINFDASNDYESTLQGAKRWSGTITADADDTAAIPEAGASGSATLNVNVDQNWSGTVVCQQIEQTVEKGDEGPVEVTFSFEGDGDLTRPA